MLRWYDSAFNDLARAARRESAGHNRCDGVYFLAVSLRVWAALGSEFELSVDRREPPAIQEQQEIQIGQSLQGRIMGPRPLCPTASPAWLVTVLEVR